MKTKKYNVKVKRLVMVWMHEEYEVDAMSPDDAEKQVDFGLVDPMVSAVIRGTEKSIPDSWNNNKPTVVYITKEIEEC